MNTRIGTKINEDYTITHVMESSNELGVAVGYQEFSGKKYWATWEYIPARENDYFWGHYMIPTEEEALKDALQRVGWLDRETDQDPNQGPDPDPMEVPMTSHEKKIVLAVFSALLEKPYRELNTFIGSETIKEMQEMYFRLRYEDYLKRYGKTYDEMNEHDWIQLYEMIEAENEAMSYIDDDAGTGSCDDDWF